MQVITETIGSLKIGKPASYSGFTIFPLLGDALREAGYLTLDEALARKQARVKEVSEGGAVPNLQFDNLGDEKILLVDGDELIGAKQNRIINLTILVPAHASIMIPVSCVEAGRWSYRSSEFSSAKRSMYSRARAAKMEHVSMGLKRVGERYSNQGAVWNDISDLSQDLGVSSETSAMSDIYEQNEDRLEDYQKAFTVQNDQVGAVFAVNNTVMSLEYFDSSQTLKHYLERLISSFALGVRSDQKDTPIPSSQEAQTFITGLKDITVERYPAIGEGEDIRISSKLITGGALLTDDRLVHLVAFNKECPESVRPGYSERPSDSKIRLRRRRH